MIISGWQFLFGGLVMALVGRASGGQLGIKEVSHPFYGILLLLYMAFISACAYTLWSLLLKYNPVSRVAVFGFVNPVIGVILSALLLHESNQAFSLVGLTSLVLVSAGIIIVNRPEKKAAVPQNT